MAAEDLFQRISNWCGYGVAANPRPAWLPAAAATVGLEFVNSCSAPMLITTKAAVVIKGDHRIRSLETETMACGGGVRSISTGFRGGSQAVLGSRSGSGYLQPGCPAANCPASKGNPNPKSRGSAPPCCQ